jgi:hypothetical protein
VRPTDRGSPTSPPSAVADASSRSDIPSPAAPSPTSARPHSARAIGSMSAQRIRRARESASSASLRAALLSRRDISARRASHTLSQASSGPGSSPPRSRLARKYQPFATAGSPRNSKKSLPIAVASRAAERRSFDSRYRRKAVCRASKRTGDSCSHQAAWPAASQAWALLRSQASASADSSLDRQSRWSSGSGPGRIPCPPLPWHALRRSRRPVQQERQRVDGIPRAVAVRAVVEAEV